MSMQSRRLLGNPDTIEIVKKEPFDVEVIDFLDAVSRDIMHHPESKKVPGLRAFGFWCRKTHLLQLKGKHRIPDGRCGKGLIFHICASNVPGLFAWSLAIGLLMGNGNIVRVSSDQTAVDTTEAFCAIFARVLSQKRYGILAKQMAIVTYPKANEMLTIRYSEQCNVRMIWGGDATIEAIQKLSCAPMPEDILFPDRTSAAFLDANTVNGLNEDELMFQTRLFYDDTYAMDQNACSSPRLLVWYGSESACQSASERWWKAVAAHLVHYQLSEKQIYDKYSLACGIAMRDECECVHWIDGRLCYIRLNAISEKWTNFKGNSGIFLEYRIGKIEDIQIIDSEKLQTLLVLGATVERLQKVKKTQHMKGISRIVSFGQALEMDLVWDGQDLIKRLTEPDFFTWQADYDDRLMLIDDRNRQMTYREAKCFGETYFDNLVKRSLICIVTENSIGSVLNYIQALRHDLIPMLLDKKTDKERIAMIVEKYQPEYIALPADFEWEPGQNYREKWQAEGYIFHECIVGEKEDMPLHHDLALLLSTSGSTGSQKFVKISKKNLQSNTSVIASYLHITEKDRPITTLPMSYTYGLSIINSHFYMGATVLLTEYSVMEQKFWDFFKQQQASTFGGVPYTYKMLKFIGFTDMLLPSLKMMTQAGGKLSVDLQQMFTKYGQKNECPFIVMYGQTEATARMAYLPWNDASRKQGSIGVAIPRGHFWLKDENGQIIVESQQTGELIYEGPNVTMGYAVDRVSLSRDDENKGCLATGDLAYRDDDGFYYITGRKKRFVKLLGNRISLDEIEGWLSQAFPELEIACTGTDEKMCVFYTGKIDDENKIYRFLSEKLSLFKKNFDVCHIAEIPRNASGKINYQRLEEIS